MKPYPQSVASERALLGGILLDPKQLDEVEIRSGEFYRPDHGELFGLMQSIWAERGWLDAVIVAEEIAKSGKEDRFGGVAYVAELPDHAPSTANLGHYCEMIRETYQKRELMRLMEASMSDIGVKQTGDILDSILEMQERFTGSKTGMQTLGDAFDELIGDLSNPGSSKRHSTGLESIDTNFGKLEPGRLYVIGGRPAMGKSAISFQMATNVAERGGRVLFYSLEMSKQELASRYLCGRAKMTTKQIESGQYIDQIRKYAEEYRSLDFHIYDDPATIEHIVSSARTMNAKRKVDIVVVDYLQLVESGSKTLGDTERLTMISRKLKLLAKDLKCVVIALSQLNRAVEQRQNKRPTLADLRGSGSIEQDADCIAFCYRDDYYKGQSGKSFDPDNVFEFIVAKRRNGKIGTAFLEWSGKHTWCSEKSILDWS
jgi:replicative DNA helicase